MKQLPFRSNNHTLNRLHGQCQFSQFDLPALVFDSRMKNAGHRREKDVPMSNLYLGLLQLFGAENEHFGESTGAFEVLS